MSKRSTAKAQPASAGRAPMRSKTFWNGVDATNATEVPPTYGCGAAIAPGAANPLGPEVLSDEQQQWRNREASLKDEVHRLKGEVQRLKAESEELRRNIFERDLLFMVNSAVDQHLLHPQMKAWALGLGRCDIESLRSFIADASAAQAKATAEACRNSPAAIGT